MNYVKAGALLCIGWEAGKLILAIGASTVKTVWKLTWPDSYEKAFSNPKEKRHSGRYPWSAGESGK